MKFALLFALMVGVTLPISAQESVPQRFVKVTGTGSVEIRSDTATVYSNLSASGESIEEAAEAFKERSNGVEEIFDPMEFRGIEIKVQDPNFSQIQSQPELMAPGMMAPGMMAVPVPDAGFSANGTIEVKISISESMESEELSAMVGKIAAGLAKAELSFNAGNSLVTFTSSNRESAEDAAIEKAMVDAKRRAEVVARLSNKKLGGVISVEISASLPNAPPVANYPYNMAPYYGVYSNGNSNQNIGVSASLEVTFELTD